MMSLLASRGANLNKVDEHGRTPLFAASQHGAHQMVALLVRHRANIYASVPTSSSCVLPIDVAYGKSAACLLHTYIIDLTLVFDLPGYVILWITDWLPHTHHLTELAKITLITNVVASIRRLRGARNESK
jgi:ankyrin repeat protein